ncbi:MAG: hypothetical protein LBT94_05520 [Prevotellaceae bacterium]|nr:hypothetical protein [Prevotellaceae bacterium]
MKKKSRKSSEKTKAKFFDCEKFHTFGLLLHASATGKKKAPVKSRGQT